MKCHARPGLRVGHRNLQATAESRADCRMWLAAGGPQLKDWSLGYLSGMSLVWNAEHKAPVGLLSILS